jgi:deoxyuridine 5'-triphosphate nucleotidohydrolase
LPTLPYRGITPTIAPDAFIADTAIVIGDVSIGHQSSLWFGVVARGDAAPIVIGSRTNLQDGAIVHADERYPTTIGDDCTLGHAAVVHGAVLEDRCLVGIGALVLNGARIGAGSVIGAGAVVAERQVIPPRSLVLGVPGKVVRELGPEHAAMPERAGAAYVELSREYLLQQATPGAGHRASLVAQYRRSAPELPAYSRSHADDAGADLIAAEDKTLAPGESGRIATNLAVALPASHYGLVSGRSGLNSRGILCHVGTIDSGYRGFIAVALTNLSAEPFVVQRGDRIGQLVVLPFALPRFDEVAELPLSDRGEKGWGSSGR